MATEVVVRYSEPLVRDAARRFLVRYVRHDLIVAAVAVLFALIAYLGLKGEWTYAAVIAAFGCGLAGLVVLTGWNYTRAAVAKFRAMNDPTVRWRFGDETFATHSDLGSAELRWQAVSAVWRFPNVWLLFFGRHGWGYSTLPVEGLPPELQEYILARIRAHGGKIA